MLPLWETDERQRCCRVTVTEMVVIPPWTEMLIEGSLEGDDVVAQCGLIESHERNHIMVAPSVVSTGVGVVPIRLMNPGENRVTLHQGTAAAMFYAIDAIGPEIAVTSGNSDTETECVRQFFPKNNMNKEDAMVPGYLQDLYERSTNFLTNQKSCQLKELLIEYQGQFSAKRVTLEGLSW